MLKFEYRKVFCPDNMELIALGNHGWELVAIEDSGKWVFKRPNLSGKDKCPHCGHIGCQDDHDFD